MVLNTQKQENLNYGGQPSPAQAKSFNWKLEKKYLLLVIGAGCLALFFWGSKITQLSLIKPLIDRLPLIGSLCFAADAIIKLSKND